ncbi:MAG TPA: DUF983 domain-containing protein [Actinomycetota bacterium]|nr:DUF983 domain-containing protein [Actinomycetota bacterium]
MAAVDDRPGTFLVILRGLTRRCPRCGGGRLFRRWFTMLPSCPRCGLVLQRGEGAFLGSLAINYGVTGVIFLAVLAGWLVVELPEVELVPLMLTCALVCVVMPLGFFPFAKTIWASIDLLLHGRRAGDAGDSESAPPEVPGTGTSS